MTLKEAVSATGLSQRQLAGELSISPAAVNSLVNNGIWPVKNVENIRLRMIALLVERGGLTPQAALNCIPASKASNSKRTNGEDIMMIRKQTLLPATKRYFNIHVDPFGAEVQCEEDLFLSNEGRYIRETMLSTAKHGGMLAIIGESGSGKSTLRRSLIEHLRKSELGIIPIEPYVLGMEDNDKTGKTLKALHIAEAILYTVAPSEKSQSSPEARFRQVHRVLKDSAKAGNKHCLILEEAHSLSYVTLKHLKRFYELEDGYKRLLSIILIGQRELKDKLAESSAEVREVVQRMEVVEVQPLDIDLAGYVRHRLARAGLDADKLLAPDALDALVIKHSGPVERNSKEAASLLYPLAVGNTLTAALNMAASIGENQITGAVISRA